MKLPNFERCDAFWARQETDRPLLANWVGSYQIANLYENGLSQLPEGELKPTDIKFESFRRDYEKLFENHRQAATDIPWASFPLMVVPWMEAITGCPIHHREGNVWAQSWLDTYDRLDEVGLKPNSAWLEVLVEFTRWLVKLSDGRFPVAVSLMRGPADLLAAMRGAQTSVYDLFDYPDQVERILNALTDIWIEVAQAQLAHIPKFADGNSFSIINLWGRKPGAWFQDDAIAFWSPALYRQYARDCEARLSSCMGATGIHLHSPALFTVDELVKMPDLDIIEVNIDDVGLKVPEMILQFQQILEKKRLFVWGAFTTEDLVVMKEKLPTRGLALQLMAETPEQLQALIREVETIWDG